MSADLLIQVANKDGAQYAWLRQSLNDFEMAKILLVAKKWDGVCYHAQQAVEKLLKFMHQRCWTSLQAHPFSP